MKLLGPEVGYTDLLDYEIEQEIQRQYNLKKEGKGKFPLSPSSAGFCARRLAYETMEYRTHAWYETEKITPQTYRLFELGHAIEYQSLKTFRLLKVMQQKYKQQVLTFFELERADKKLKKEIMEGQCDFVLWSEKYKAIGDVKSKKDKFSYAFKSSWDEEMEKFSNMSSLYQISETAFYADDLDLFIEELGEDFLLDNLYQLNLYAHSDFIRSRGVDHCFLYRYNKNDSRHMEIRFRPSEKAFEYVKNKFNAVNVAVDKQNPDLVEREYFLGSSRCAFCPFNKTCWGDENALKEFFHTLPYKKWPTDVYKLSNGEEVAKLFEKFEAHEVAQSVREMTERECAKAMVENEIKKIRLENGNIYELKQLKTPRLHYEVRRSKI